MNIHNKFTRTHHITSDGAIYKSIQMKNKSLFNLVYGFWISLWYLQTVLQQFAIFQMAFQFDTTR
jgi:hypothetical protein